MEKQTNNIIDLSYLEATFDKNQAIINKILLSFMDKTPSLLIQLNKEINNNNWNEVKMIAHKIKSSFNTVGAKYIGEVLGQIENESSEQNKSSIQVLINQIKEPSSDVFKKIEFEIAK
jgi:HPt (histidine-containing phosphotransfer) domain-containing protein